MFLLHFIHFVFSFALVFSIIYTFQDLLEKSKVVVENRYFFPSLLSSFFKYKRLKLNEKTFLKMDNPLKVHSDG